MVRTPIEELLLERKVALREFSLAFARLVAGLAVDPHGYFEKKYTARIERAVSDQEISGVLVQLLQWALSSGVSDEQRRRLDTELGALGLPLIEDLRGRLLR